MKTKISKLLACCLFMQVLFLNSCLSTPPNEPETTNELVLNLNEVIDDMFSSIEGTPHGSHHEFSLHPTFGQYTGGSSKTSDWKNGFDNWTDIRVWGQLYASNHNNQCSPRYGVFTKNCVQHELCSPNINFPNIRVHLKDLELYIYREISQNNYIWERIDYVDFIDKNPNQFGCWYVENFENNKHMLNDVHFEPEGGISTQAGSGWNFHFWGHTINIESKNVGLKGIFVVCKARIIGVEGDQDPKYLLSVGSDYYRSDGRLEWGSSATNLGVGCGRFKYVTEQWRYHTFFAFNAEAPTAFAIREAAKEAIIKNPSFSEVLLKHGIICE